MSEFNAIEPPPSAALLRALAAHPDQLADVIAVLHQPVRDVRSLLLLLRRVSTLAVSRLAGVSAAGIVAQFDGPPITAAHTDQRVLMLDEYQYGAGDGPGLQAMRTGHPVAVSIPEIGQRWPLLAAAAAALGVGSTLAVPLQLSGSAVGAINLYSTQSMVPPPDADILTVLTEYAERGFEAYQRRRRSTDVDGIELQQVLAGWTAVEQAVGMLMQRHGFSARYAREVLGDLAQDWERTVIDQALHIITTDRA